jgi:small subunit ribosomal protein S11
VVVDVGLMGLCSKDFSITPDMAEKKFKVLDPCHLFCPKLSSSLLPLPQRQTPSTPSASHQLRSSSTMPKNAISRLFVRSICSNCRTKIRNKPLARAFSTTVPKLADSDSSPPRRPQRSSNLSGLFSSIQGDAQTSTSSSPPPPKSSMGPLKDILSTFNDSSNSLRSSKYGRTTGFSELIPNADGPPPSREYHPSIFGGPKPEPHHLHIYSTKHNTHITLTRPNREPILSFSSGNIGFRKAQRGSYDAAFQLAAYVMKMIQDRGLLRTENAFSAESSETTSSAKGAEAPIKSLEVVVRGFGKGRDAVMKALLGHEGRVLRNRVMRLSDSTRLKFGGTRSPNPRRLG